MFKRNELYQKLIDYPIVLLIVLLPFNAIITTFFTYKIGIANFWVYKDVLVGIILLAGLGYYWRKLLNPVVALMAGFSVLMIAGMFWAPDQSLLRFVAGGKYGFWFFGAFAVGLFASEISDKSRYLKIAVYSGLSAILIGLVLHFAVSPEWMVNLGFRNDWSTHYAGQAPAFCQKIEHSPVCRLQGSFAGPNQLGAYILILNALVFAYFGRKKYYISGFLFLVCLLTFSRSAILGMLIMNCLFIGKDLKLSKKSVGTIFGGGAIGLASLVALKPDLFLRPASSFEHWQSWQVGFEHFLNSVFWGNGLATSGSASKFFDNPIIPENWFLGIMGQVGLTGLIMFLAIYYLTAKNSGAYFLRVLAIAMLVPLMLLHSFEDATVAYMYFFLFGLYYKYGANKESKSDVNLAL